MSQSREDVKIPTGFVHKVPHPGGRPRKFKKASDLWDKFVEYCDFMDGNPWQIRTASNSIDSRSNGNVNGMRQQVTVRQRAYTLQGFCAFAGVCYKWADFKKNYKEQPGFKVVIDQIENVVCAQQLDGAMINQFDSSLVARLNGFADKQQMEVTGKDGEDFKWPKLSISDLDYLKQVNGL